ncbi:HNH endonuclease [Burkholderia cenocepacia]|uniref:HNH endonuclease n=1 Tax=Burkholderia cenocepacia TaxID=95486 RepID=A0A6B2MI50_9BURK|nr:HNH endonuclease [Burkholderia cenocepacia]NDV74402.1 HNH endonuclease [Burkholderia cenocepacia]
MRAIKKPTYPENYSFQTCTDSVTDGSLQRRLRGITEDMGALAKYYDGQAALGQLHTVPPTTAQDPDLLIGEVTKAELKNLYDREMVPRLKPGRRIYDELRLSAPNSRCPTCGIGQVFTIDHFLPKSKFPLFSVLPENLVPACRDCNTGKLAAAANDAQSFHPYYDTKQLSEEQWISAELLQTDPIAVRYFVRAPQNWDDFQVRRAMNHFHEYKLAQRFGSLAAEELSTLTRTFTSPYPMKPNEVWDALDRRLAAERENRSNSWQIALLEALRDSEWFCALGFFRH